VSKGQEVPAEMLELARETGVSLQISHIGSMAAFGQVTEVLGMIDEAVFSGMDVGIDCYPYNAFCCSIGSATYDEGFLDRCGQWKYAKCQLPEGANVSRWSCRLFRSIG
jgi:N-acyl-D-amino-acid deacylase